METRILSGEADWRNELQLFGERSIFHSAEFLEGVRTESRLQLIRLEVLHKGAPVLLLPVFAKRKGGLVSLLSPPPDFAIEYLGPLYNLHPSAKRDKQEAIRIDATRAAVQALDAAYRPILAYVRSGPDVQDVRPFQWLGFRSSPLYTYEIDLTAGLERVKESFKRELRNDLSRTADRLTIYEEGEQAVDTIHRLVDERFQSQELSFEVSPRFLRGIFRKLARDQITAFVAESKAAPIGGLIVTCYNGRASAWIGARSTAVRGSPVSDQLLWHAIVWSHAHGARKFELMGANTERLRAFKAKYNAALVTFYQLERAGATGRLVMNAYRTLRGRQR